MRGSGCKCTVRDDHDDDDEYDEDDDGDVDHVWDALGLPCMLKPIQTSLAPGLLPSRPNLSDASRRGARSRCAEACEWHQSTVLPVPVPIVCLAAAWPATRY